MSAMPCRQPARAGEPAGIQGPLPARPLFRLLPKCADQFFSGQAFCGSEPANRARLPGFSNSPGLRWAYIGTVCGTTVLHWFDWKYCRLLAPVPQHEKSQRSHVQSRRGNGSQGWRRSQAMAATMQVQASPGTVPTGPVPPPRYGPAAEQDWPAPQAGQAVASRLTWLPSRGHCPLQNAVLALAAARLGLAGPPRINGAAHPVLLML